MKKFLSITAPKRWVFKDPDSGREFEGNTKRDLVERIISYRSQNELPLIENISAVIDNYLCEQPENFGSCFDDPLPRGLMQYFRGGIALVKQLMYNNFVRQYTADLRAAQCIRCPNNVFPSNNKAAFEKWSDDLAEQTVGDRKSQYHILLGNCIACTCPLRAKVFYGDKITLTPEEKEKVIKVMPTCWQLEGK